MEHDLEKVYEWVDKIIQAINEFSEELEKIFGELRQVALDERAFKEQHEELCYYRRKACEAESRLRELDKMALMGISSTNKTREEIRRNANWK